MHTPHSEQVQANEAYQLLPMPVPAVLVTLHGAQGGLLLDEGTGKEVGYVRTRATRARSRALRLPRAGDKQAVSARSRRGRSTPRASRCESTEFCSDKRRRRRQSKRE